MRKVHYGFLDFFLKTFPLLGSSSTTQKSIYPFGSLPNNGGKTGVVSGKAHTCGTYSSYLLYVAVILGHVPIILAVRILRCRTLTAGGYK